LLVNELMSTLITLCVTVTVVLGNGVLNKGSSFVRAKVRAGLKNLDNLSRI